MSSRRVELGLRVLIMNLGRSLGTGFWVTLAVESAPAGSSSGSMDTTKDRIEANLPLTATTFLSACCSNPQFHEWEDCDMIASNEGGRNTGSLCVG